MSKKKNRRRIPCSRADVDKAKAQATDEATRRAIYMVGDNQYVAANGFCSLGERKGGDE